MTTDSANGGGGERFTGHGSEWNNSNLSNQDAQTATSWVEQKIDKRSMLTNKDRVEDVRDIMWQLEKDGEIVVHRVTDDHQPVMHKTLYGWDKKIPTNRLWHHKSCGQCGNIPGYPTSLLWLMNELGLEYLDETDQTSCTAWNYHGSGIGNLESLAAVFLRNFHQAYVSAKAEGKPEAITIRWSIVAPRSAITRKCAAICCIPPSCASGSRRSWPSWAASSTASC